MNRVINNFFLEEPSADEVLQFFYLITLGLERSSQNIFCKEIGFFNQPYGKINTNWSNTVYRAHPQMISGLSKLFKHKRFFLWRNYVKEFIEHLIKIDNFVYFPSVIHQIIYHPSNDTLEMKINEKYSRIATIKWDGTISVNEYIGNYGQMTNFDKSKTLEELMKSFIEKVKLLKFELYETRNKIS